MFIYSVQGFIGHSKIVVPICNQYIMPWKKTVITFFKIIVFVTGCKSLLHVHERESSSQSDPQSFSSPSGDERDSFYEDMCGKVS